MTRQRTQTPHEATAQPRRLRIAAAGVAMAVTLVAVLGATGVLPSDGASEPAFAGTATAGSQAGSAVQSYSAIALSGSVSASLPRHPQFRSPDTSQPVEPRRPMPPMPLRRPELPDRSGQGKRIVFDMGDQRVWLVSDKGQVRRTYLVSGSLTDNLSSGSYEVYSKSMHAVGINDSGTMQYMVRFTQGDNAAIGFHDLPIHRGEKVQTRRQLGTPQSHGCIRQWRPDAQALWSFAPLGTTVVVLD